MPIFHRSTDRFFQLTIAHICTTSYQGLALAAVPLTGLEAEQTASAHVLTLSMKTAYTCQFASKLPTQSKFRSFEKGRKILLDEITLSTLRQIRKTFQRERFVSVGNKQNEL